MTHLHMPLLAHGIDHTALDGSPTGTADGDTHLVVAGQTVELPLQLPGISSQFLTADTQRPINFNSIVCPVESRL